MIHVQKKLPESNDMFNIEGILLTAEPMWRHSTMIVGGAADYYAVPEGEEDLRRLLTAAEGRGTEWFILGGGSNILVADSGIRGLVIDMRRFDEHTVNDDVAILGGGLEISEAAWRLGSTGRAGLDFLFGMPGSVGGAVWMNARCYGREVADVLEWVDVMDSGGAVRREPTEGSEWGYKISPYQSAGTVILRAGFRVRRNDPRRLRTAMMEKRNDREAKGHYRAPCAGSAFKNNRGFGEPSGVLIDRCGLKGFSLGSAGVSDWHGNIFVNRGGAKAREIRDLLSLVAQRVEDSTGFRMEPEILIVGDWKEEGHGRDDGHPGAAARRHDGGHPGGAQ